MPLTVNPVTGWLRGVKRIRSPNCDARPAGCMPELIVIHGISLPPGKFGGPWIDRLFTNAIEGNEHAYFAQVKDLRVSSHALIRRDGDLTQFVSFNVRAWHAGDSSYCGRRSCNDFSIGVELEGADDVPYENVQYTVLATLVAELRRAYPSLLEAELVGHSDISPGRKTDPGRAFDWALLHRELEPIKQ
jgi:AmpD protein